MITLICQSPKLGIGFGIDELGKLMVTKWDWATVKEATNEELQRALTILNYSPPTR